MKKSVCVLIAATLAASTLALAQPREGPRGGDRMNERHHQLKETLHLTDQQDAQIRKLHLELERRQAQAHSKIQLARLDMKEIYMSDKLDRATIEKAIKQVSDLQHEVKMNFVDFWFSVNSLLTPDQQKMWKQHVPEMIGEMRERMGERMRRGGPMHNPPDDDQDEH